ncbi:MULTISPECIES: ClC family H(+)/Cl(-) exchange transporter [Lactobacillus]|uniref:ClC family H(+)/Cl(-) exchange transporter n=1 Tax=Lactobacillus xujianguonis TaxID=2495899 RepID=A0A437SXM9_9LACO|nr:MULTISPECIES: ClC family H(+)/Cl(-) exchange transporter [Lactobacillus]RVU71682.1 ClC family H(+)/Cl(-) exchange transporter [Lactobacillus xujianguonis]RVU77667.1 ClC family H(+)/Cl(-) exchange transporter [Lactobacillus xujianguonis]
MIKHAKQILNQPFNLRLTRVLIRALIVGLFTGLLVGIFRWIIDHTMQLLTVIYPQMMKQPLLLIPYIIFLIVIALLIAKVMGPYSDQLTGSGVPQIEAVFLNENRMPAWQIVWRKFIGGLLAICPGLMLGREGPCIEMGAMIGQGLGKDFFKTNQEDLRLLQECGVAAGLSAAFSAPLAGVFFLVEEITFDFKPISVVTALIASFASDLVTLFFFGTKPCLYFPIKTYLPLKYYWILPVLGIILGLLAYLYQYCLLSLKPFFHKITIIPNKYHSLIPLLLIIPVGLWNPRLLGGSHDLIIDLFQKKLTLPRISSAALFLLPLLVFAVRFIFSMLSYGATVPGGIFMPILVLGSALGVTVAQILVQLNLISPNFYPHLLVIAMAAYFGAIEKAPITAIILLTEMVGSVQQVLPIVITTCVSYYVLDFLGGKPIYEALRLQMNYPGDK